MHKHSPGQSSLEQRFRQAMHKLYVDTLQYYPASGFREMLDAYDGVGTAQLLLQPQDTFHEGFIKIVYEFERPDLTVEWLVLQEPWKQLFSTDELEEARRRLRAVHVEPPG